jgi:hypothetical protein
MLKYELDCLKYAISAIRNAPKTKFLFGFLCAMSIRNAERRKEPPVLARSKSVLAFLLSLSSVFSDSHLCAYRDADHAFASVLSLTSVDSLAGKPRSPEALLKNREKVKKAKLASLFFRNGQPRRGPPGLLEQLSRRAQRRGGCPDTGERHI